MRAIRTVGDRRQRGRYVLASVSQSRLPAGEMSQTLPVPSRLTVTSAGPIRHKGDAQNSTRMSIQPEQFSPRQRVPNSCRAVFSWNSQDISRPRLNAMPAHKAGVTEQGAQ